MPKAGRRAGVAGPRTIPPTAAGASALRFPGLSGTVHLRGAAAVAEGLGRIMHGWRAEPASPRARAVTRVTGRRAGDGYHVDSDWLDEPFERLSLVGAVNAVAADLCESWVEDRPGRLALHAGAVLFQGQLIAFAGTHRAGKSTLAARLTAEPDMRLFADDMLPVTGAGEGVAMGVAPRLRLPLPEAATPAFRDHVAARRSLFDDRYAYLDSALVAPHGQTVPLTAFLVLSREEGAPARLHAMADTDAVARLLRHNMSDAGAGGAVHDHAAFVAARVLCLRLVYSDLEEAVSLIRAAFGGAGLPAAGVAIGPPIADIGAESDPVAVAVDRVWARSPGTALRRRGEMIWLWQPEGQGMHHLNPVAAAVWQLLDEPQSAQALGDILSDLFPGTDPAVITRDVAQLLGHLAAAGLVRAARG